MEYPECPFQAICIRATTLTQYLFEGEQYTIVRIYQDMDGDVMTESIRNKSGAQHDGFLLSRFKPLDINKKLIKRTGKL